MNEPIECLIYRCSRQQEMYLYVPRGTDLEEIPDGLLRFLGRLEAVMELSLDTGRKLARADVNEVMEKLRGQGYYVQMPPRPFRPRLRQGE